MTSRPDEPDDDTALDAAATLALIHAQQEHVRDRGEPDARLLFAMWGLAWLGGYLALYLTARTSPTLEPAPLAFAVFGVALVAAAIATVVHVLRRSSGIRGPSATSGAMFGWSWFLGFVAVYLVNTGIVNAGASPEVIAIAWNSTSCLLVGVLYMAGGALWQEKPMFALGVWIVVVTGAAAVAGMPWTYLVMAVAGGGGMLALALADHLRRVRRARR
ncbi:hypothetical protein GCM10011331_11900 [Flavimobilis marinus]|uniref:Uncharacterized protein n=1 Tax=Flavimobilis marinus TaxID=285351 RepID=A0A1I2HZ45_9MICO|nr:hypothetical protein [Flavimobilis marinus]GHG49384.1 hypothetical protein GCM10011331_11900 [Flavimobilis marinus]SFF34047.1 hypothetical protein SAMN04488035_2579 [Flavimobilis marinus]